MPWETSIAHNASKCLRDGPFRTEVVSFVVIAAPVVWVLHALLGLCVIISWAVSLVYLRF
jgi:hypothetical protein